MLSTTVIELNMINWIAQDLIGILAVQERNKNIAAIFRHKRIVNVSIVANPTVLLCLTSNPP